MLTTALFVLGILFLTVVAPVWIVLHYLTIWRSMKQLTPQDETLLAELWDSAQRLEDRIATLERAVGAEPAAASQPHRHPEGPRR